MSALANIYRREILTCRSVAGTLALLCIAGCSSDNPVIVESPNCIATTTDFSATGGAAAGDTAIGSTGGDVAGAANPNSGGTDQVDNSQAVGGAEQGGTFAGASGLAGGTSGTASCPEFNATGGVLITPPSNGFESDITDWTTMTLNPSALSLKQSNACQGSSYLACDGAARADAWDGPRFVVLPYVIVGHQYAVTVAARFDPENAPAAAGTIILSTVNACTDSSVSTVFANLQQATTISDWVRLSGTVEPVLTGCSELSEMTVYVESGTDYQQYSIDVDDFQLWDVTPAP